MSAPVLILEGAGASALASVILTDYTCLDWNDVPEDRAAFAGRDVQLWALNDANALKLAGSLAKSCATISIVDMRADDRRRSFADVLDERQTGDAVVDFMRARLKPIQTQDGPKRGASHDVEVQPKAQGLGAAYGVWQSLGLECNAQGHPFPTIANAYAILCAHEEIKDRIWFDEFTGKIMQTVKGVASAWTDAEDLRVCIWLQKALKIPKLGLQMATHAVQAVAFERSRNPLTEYLNSLVWDTVPRLNEWLSDHLGAPNSPYTQMLGRNWLISMVARAFKPGCQADHMPVLEGKMGRGKSSALAILGGPWYRAAPQAFGSRDFLEVIQGSWLVEIPDMVGFGKREHSQIISAITTRTDSYRAPYARHPADHPRGCIFAATSEEDDYLQDSRGIRRYWPVRCRDINLETLARARDQLFAEAVAAYRSGSAWHEMPIDTSVEQMDRVDDDPWAARLEQYCIPTLRYTSGELLATVEVELKDQNDGHKRRIKKTMLKLGWSQKVEKIEGRTVRKYSFKAK